MVSRRSFLKLTGLAAVAAGAGYTAGKFNPSPGTSHYTVHGFIPAEEDIIRKIVRSFKQKARSNSCPTVLAEGRMKEILAQADGSARSDGFSKGGTITYRMEGLSGPVDADIIISDEKVALYSPENNFPGSFSSLRNELRGRKADVIFTAEYNECGFLANISKGSKKEVVIENDKGVQERVPLDKNYAAIWIEGSQGKTGLKISNGIAMVHASACRHGLCKHTHAAEAGSIIACAPNKVLIRVEPT